MIDADTAREGSRLLATAIGELMEDTAHEAATLGRGATPALAVERIIQAGQDIAALAAALRVMARPAEADRAHDVEPAA